ncbi:MAG: hypothetical protein UU21_C0030G0002 [Candidatus Levybacteria bacterium GW2011_GWA2_40_8]|nr:MAG: hypothetical protein UU21_C0030G0002 [Candidatus Levybacteria bacterium GW2011_GWA2_40_8]
MVKGRAHGWVYLIKHGRFNQYRIGQTTNILRRWKENKIELPRGTETHSYNRNSRS